MPASRPTPRDDAADLHDHPEWFAPNPRRKFSGSYRGIPIYIVSEPLFVRKPTPFVLPIRGSAL